MKLLPIQNPRPGQSVQCAGCSAMVPAAQAVADMEGVPFLSYYHPACIPALHNWEYSGDSTQNRKGQNLMTKKQIPPLYVFVHGGTVTQVTDAKGQITAAARIIDYDNEENGQCPVCLGEVSGQDMETAGHFACTACGYDEEKDNALECSVAWHAADDAELSQ